MTLAVALYTDGCVLDEAAPVVGGWAWCQVGAHGGRVRQGSGVIVPWRPWARVTSNLLEMIALVRGLEALPAGWRGEVCTDSETTLGRLLQGWAARDVPPWLQRRGESVVARLGQITPVLLDSHPTPAQLAAGIGRSGLPVSRHNAFCDALCRRVALEYRSLHVQQEA